MPESVDRIMCRGLARHFLAEYALAPAARTDAVDRLAELFHLAAEDYCATLGVEKR
jgi:hypothetical protein